MQDAWQARGVGSALMAHIAGIAIDNGIPGFAADVLANNQPMLNVFRNAGFPFETDFAEGVISLRMPLFEPVPLTAPDGAAAAHAMV